MKKPNILFILMDDLGYKDIGCNGSTFYETPNIDALAKSGMNFTNAYAACPVCSPSRASIMTGKYPARVGITNYIYSNSYGKLCHVPYLKELPLQEKTIANTLKDNGYNTYHIGKWHIGNEKNITENFGFDVNISGCEKGDINDTYYSPLKIEDIKNPKNYRSFLDNFLTDKAVETIENNGNEPMFMYMCFYSVHIPIQAPQHLIDKYTEKAKKLKLDKAEAMIEGGNVPHERLKERKIVRRLIQSDPTYAAMVENMDINVGKLIDALKRTGKLDDTLIIFTSDNGGLSTMESSPTCNLPLREGKGWLEEGGVREPLIVSYPGLINESTVCHEPVTSPDFYPTLLDIAGIDKIPNQHVDGKSFIDALEGKEFRRGPIFWHYPNYSNQGSTPGCSVRCDNYKLIQFFEYPDQLELYDLEKDISETVNLVDKLPEKRDELYKILAEWRDTEVKGIIPKPNPNYNPFD